MYADLSKAGVSQGVHFLSGDCLRDESMEYVAAVLDTADYRTELGSIAAARCS